MKRFQPVLNLVQVFRSAGDMKILKKFYVHIVLRGKIRFNGFIKKKIKYLYSYLANAQRGK